MHSNAIPAKCLRIASRELGGSVLLQLRLEESHFQNSDRSAYMRILMLYSELESYFKSNTGQDSWQRFSPPQCI